MLEQDNNELIDAYEFLFKKNPPLNIIAGYDDIMIDLIKDAIKRGKPLSREEVETAYKGIPIDISNGSSKQFTNFKKGE